MSLGTQAVVSAVGGNYWGAALQGAQLAKSATNTITSTADVWSDEMRKVNDWNEQYDRYGNEKIILLI